VPRGVVPAGLDVRAAGQDEPVEALDQGGREVLVGIHPRRDQQRDGSGPFDVPDVVVREQRRGLVGPVTTGGPLDVARDPDDRARWGGHAHSGVT
jgi:hypothetical protein